MSKVHWKDQGHSYHTAEIGIIRLSVIWESEGFQVAVDGFTSPTLMKHFPELADAKKAAEALAMKKLTEALEVLR
jgi:hypothetical protein